MQKEEIKAVWDRYRSGKATKEDRALLEGWYLNYEHEGLADLTDTELEDRVAAVRRKLPLLEEDTTKYVKVKRLWPRLAAAASVLLCLSVGGYFLLHKQPQQQIAQNQPQYHDIPSGGNKAVLTLASGKQIILTDAKNGKLVEQGNTVINKTQDGQVVYSASKASRQVSGGDLKGTIAYNTMATPRGGQYHLTLSDGTNVWLNAASSIKYPTAFTGNDRQVEITGEAYFEVAHNAAKPFSVISNGQTVEVLGTHFNINAYADEPAIKTTLLEGSVKFNAGSHQGLLYPGQQSVFNTTTAALTVQLVDVSQVIAWKNGFFEFDNIDLATLMRQISRWYDVDIIYQNIDNKSLFGGGISRKLNLSQVLHLLETNKLHFKIEGRKVIVF